MSPAERAAARPLPSGAPAAAPARRARPGGPRLRVAAVTDRRSVTNVVGTVALVLLFVSVLGVVVFQALLVQTQSTIDDLGGEIRAEEERADDLRLRLAELQSPERIVAEARDRLGMVAPAEVLYLQHDAGDDAAATLDPSEMTTTTTTPPATTAPAAGGATAAAPTTGASTAGAATAGASTAGAGGGAG